MRRIMYDKTNLPEKLYGVYWNDDEPWIFDEETAREKERCFNITWVCESKLEEYLNWCLRAFDQ